MLATPVLNVNSCNECEYKKNTFCFRVHIKRRELCGCPDDESSWHIKQTGQWQWSLGVGE